MAWNRDVYWLPPVHAIPHHHVNDSTSWSPGRSLKNGKGGGLVRSRETSNYVIQNGRMYTDHHLIWRFFNSSFLKEADYLKEEINSIENSVSSYFQDMWNYFDWIVYSLSFLVLVNIFERIILKLFAFKLFNKIKIFQNQKYFIKS